MLREGGPTDGLVTLDCALNYRGVDAMGGFVCRWQGRICGFTSFITCVWACDVMVGARGCTFGTCGVLCTLENSCTLGTGCIIRADCHISEATSRSMKLGSRPMDFLVALTSRRRSLISCFAFPAPKTCITFVHLEMAHMILSPCVIVGLVMLLCWNCTVLLKRYLRFSLM